MVLLKCSHRVSFLATRVRDFSKEFRHRHIRKENNVRLREKGDQWAKKCSRPPETIEGPFEGAMPTFPLTWDVRGAWLWERCETHACHIQHCRRIAKWQESFQLLRQSNSSKPIRPTCPQQRCQLLTPGHPTSSGQELGDCHMRACQSFSVTSPSVEPARCVSSAIKDEDIVYFLFSLPFHFDLNGLLLFLC